MDGTGGKIRQNNVKYQMPIEYEKEPALFSIKLHYATMLGKSSKKLEKSKHLYTKLNTYASPTPRSSVFIEELPSSSIIPKIELRNTNVNDIELVPFPANVNVQDPRPLPVNANTNENETVESIVQELMSINYEFDPFEDNMTASLIDQPCVNEQERAMDDNNEPEETLVEGETIAE
ncbi:hypothetical protein Tco_1299541 [Tanacetum coccineum]